MKYIGLYKRVITHDEYRSIGLVEADSPLEAEQEVVSRLDDEQQRSWFNSRIIIKLFVLDGGFDESHDMINQEDLNRLRAEEDRKHLADMEPPEGGWPRGSDADRL